MVDALDSLGWPYTRSLQELDGLQAELDAWPTSHGAAHRRPVVAFLRGDRAAAKAMLESGLEERADRTDLEADIYRSFVARMAHRYELRIEQAPAVNAARMVYMPIRYVGPRKPG
jgi:hypothetical protein